MQFRFPLRYGEFLDQWKYQLLETLSRLVCKCIRQFGDSFIWRSCQEVKHVNFDDCSVYRTIKQESICGHGLKIHHNLLPYKNSLTRIYYQLLHRQGGPYKIRRPSWKFRNRQHEKVNEILPRTSLLCFTLYKVTFLKVHYFLKVQFHALFHSLIQDVSELRFRNVLITGYKRSFGSILVMRSWQYNLLTTVTWNGDRGPAI
jgi:hypothetical protein